MMNLNSRWFRFLLVSVASAAVLTGCSNTSGSPDQDSTQAAQAGGEEDDWPIPSEFDSSSFVPDGTKSANGQVVKDITKETLPIDGLFKQDYILEANVRNAVIHQCFADKGINLPKPRLATSLAPPTEEEFHNPDNGLFIFNEKSAAVDGYQSVGSTVVSGQVVDNDGDPFVVKLQEYLKDVQLPTEVPTGESEPPLPPKLKNLEECTKKIEEMFPKPGAYRNFTEPPKLEEEKKDPEAILQHFQYVETSYLGEKAKEWKACMQPLGIPDLPDTPLDMPPESKMRVWDPSYFAGESEDGSSGTTTAEPTPFGEPTGPSDDEKAVAVKDAQCRNSSGWAQAYYDTRWGLIEAHLKENEKGIKEYADSIRNREDKMRAYLEEHK